MSSTATDRARRRRQSKACTRCRKRKIRCDFHYPACGACVTAGTECVGFDSIHGVEKPRSIVTHLEEEVARLEQELKDARARVDADGGATSGEQSFGAARTTIDRLVTQLATATVSPEGPLSTTTDLTAKDRVLLPLTSSVFFVGSPAPHLHSPVAWDETRQGRQGQANTPSSQESTPPVPTVAVSSSSAVPISSIPRHVAVIMLKHYCEIYRPQYPAVEETDLLAAFDRVYDRDDNGVTTLTKKPSDFDIFCVHMTLAISTTTLMYRDEGRAATATAGFWATAVAHLGQASSSSSTSFVGGKTGWGPWQQVQALQLLTHYGFLNPKDVDCVRCTAATLRLCVELGLHRELPAGQQRHVDERVLDVRRRLFWHAYGIDVAANVTRCRPCSMPSLSPTDTPVTAQMPVGLGPSSPTAHVWALRRMEAEIMERLYYSQSHTDDSALSTWDSEIRVRLAAWHQATRQSVSLSEKLEFAEIHYHMQRLRLSRPSPRRPVPLPEQQKECLAAAVAVLREFDVIARLGKLFYIWHAAHCVVEAGICLLAVAIEASTASSNTSITATSEVRTTEIMSVGDVPILTRHLKTFPGILWKIARRWPAIVHHAATLESLSTAVAERLQQWAAGTLTATTSTSSSPGTSAAAIKQKLKDMSLFSPFPMDAEAARRAQEELSRLQSLRGLGTVNSADSAADVNTAQTTVTDADITAPFDANWALPPLSPGQVLAFSSSATLVDGTVTAASTDDVLDWDFAGVGFEEIFAALIQANHGEGEDENTQGNQASELVS